ncbi:Maff2 family protein [Butyrivibrio fibrisolvens]|uniref:Maff2 family mobile element protein n=1 Tax=Butyrivibrio fibrisolvens TaxID=831 RepID=UPI000933F7DD|nr:Maff2 family protein [Butyrivibrio fibrisolvens]
MNIVTKRVFGQKAPGAGLGVWGVVNLLEGYGNDNPGAKSQGMKQLMAGGV